MANGNVITLDSQNFETEVMQSELPVLVDFWASWCGPCRMISPIIDQLADEFKGKIKVGKVNVDEERDLAGKYKVMSIPTLILFKDGQILDQVVGARPKGELERFIQKAL